MRVLFASVALALLGLAAAQPESSFRLLGIDPSAATIPVREVLSGGPPPQGIPAIGFGGLAGVAPASREPSFLSSDEAAAWLAPAEPVIVLTLAGETRLYPLQILVWHEIVNDTLGGAPVAVTFCPLCNSALAFDRRVPLNEAEAAAVRSRTPEAKVSPPSAAFVAAVAAAAATGGAAEGGAPAATVEVTFGVSGLLYGSNLLMFDDATGTLWSQLVGEGSVGTLAGRRLLRYPAQILAFGEARTAFPDAGVLSRDTGFGRSYGANPYLGYDAADSPPFLYNGPLDGRLPPKARAVTIDAAAGVAYPFDLLERERVVNDAVADTPVVVFWAPGTASALDARQIADGRDVGTAAVFERRLGERVLSFGWDGEAFVDEETGSRWDLLGRAVAGPLAGEALAPVAHDITLWFAWAAFRPETRIYGLEGTP